MVQLETAAEEGCCVFHLTYLNHFLPKMGQMEHVPN